MNAPKRKIDNFIGWARQSDGYLKSCRDCGRIIYLHRDDDGIWRPYRSWNDGDVDQRTRRTHKCRSASEDAKVLSQMSEQEFKDLAKYTPKAGSVITHESKARPVLRRQPGK
jgi:hypothetical protein